MSEENKTEANTPNIWNAIALRGLRTGAHIPVVEEEFDREKALAGLAHNFQFNRRPKPKVTQGFRKIIEDGSFAIGSMIRIARNETGKWVLIDGQHRLDAIAQSEAKIWLTVAIDERSARDAYASIDNVGTLRTPKDAVSSILGWSTSYWGQVCSAARIIASNFNRSVIKSANYSSASKTKTAYLLAETISEYKDEIKAITKNSTAESSRAPGLSAMIVAARYQPEIFWPFFEAARKDDLLRKNSPEKRMVEIWALPGRGDENRLKIFFYTTACWNAAYLKKDLPKFPAFMLGEERSSRIPKILGTPYPK